MNKFFLFFLLLPFFSYKTPFAGDDVFFGDSITFGNELGSAQYTARWSAQYCVGVSSIERNFAASGASMIPGLVGGRPSFDINDVPAYQSSSNHIFVSYWVNDFLYGANPNAFAGQTLSAVNRILAKGWPAEKIVLCFNYLPESGPTTWPYLTHTIALEWLAALRSVQQSKGTSFLDFYTFVYNHPDKGTYSGDGIHPTAAWNTIMKDFALTNIEPPNPSLPVTLQSFSCRPFANKNVLTWTVAAEANVLKYEIEKSENGTSWLKAGEVASRGNSSNAVSYSFTDNIISATKKFYRLRIIDQNGTIKFSPVVAVKGNKSLTSSAVELSPNPVQSSLNLLIDALKKETLRVAIVDVSGRTHLTKQVAVEEGVNAVMVNTNTLPQGSYFIRVMNDANNGKGVTIKFVKQ